MVFWEVREFSKSKFSKINLWAHRGYTWEHHIEIWSSSMQNSTNNKKHDRRPEIKNQDKQVLMLSKYYSVVKKKDHESDKPALLLIKVPGVKSLYV